MNDNALLISYNRLTEESIISENYNPKTIRTLIKEVQEMEAAPVLGAALFEKLKADIAAQTLAGKYKDLVNDKLKPLLINGILKDLPFVGNYRFENIGTVERTAENTKSVDPKELQKLSDFYKGRCSWYSGKLTEYLNDNAADFPEYTNNNCGKGPESGTFRVSILL